jgi:hypothetical protein
MATVEEQLKQLAKDVKTIGVEQIKGNQDLKELVEWKQTSSRTAADLQASIDNLTSRIQALEDTFFKPPPVVPLREEEGRAISHGKSIINQGVDPGSSAPGSTLVKGENLRPKTSYTLDFPEHSTKHVGYTSTYALDTMDPPDRKTHSQFHYPRDTKIPKLDFPKFNGEHPRVWKDRCEKYFSMYNLLVHLWVPFATLNFESNASLWLQTYEA